MNYNGWIKKVTDFRLKSVTYKILKIRALSIKVTGYTKKRVFWKLLCNMKSNRIYQDMF
jgi:hypothetical protein